MFVEWLHAPQRLRLVFLTAMLLLTGTLSWLAWRLLAQDQQLSVQRQTEQRDTAADLAVAALEKRLSAVEQDLSRTLADASVTPTSPSAGVIHVEFRSGEIRAWPEHSLVYYPELAEAGEASAASFTAADELEFKNHDHAGAVALLREPAASTDLKIRAAALVRIARNNLKDGHAHEAMDTYTRLSDLGPVPVGGMPAALAADVGRLAVCEQEKDQRALVEAARLLARDLSASRWPISYPTYQYLAEEAGRWLPDTERPNEPRVALADGVRALWERLTLDGSPVPGGRVTMTTAEGSVLLVWRASDNVMAGFVAGTDYLEQTWLVDMKPMLETRQVQLALTDLDGHSIVGRAADPGGRPAIRLASATGLPWTVQVFNAGNADAALRARRTLLLASMGVLLALIVTGGWFIGHAVSRELAVARLQTDFVSAVSHEFRTPLTTLCQLSELLARGRTGEADRQRYYEFLHTESDRLRRLVETLLNFGRLESGKLQFRFEELDAAALLRQSAARFSAGHQARGHRVEVNAPPERCVVRADRETLCCVFWNLFENAAKYSPDCDTVWVDLTNRGRRVEIAVRDRGAGIPAGEQRRIFEKFVRGSAARASDVRGTGIGLAMARQIARAHGGDITVESAPAKGSTFTIVLPVHQLSTVTSQ
jgi:signal transduction histidine kinase